MTLVELYVLLKQIVAFENDISIGMWLSDNFLNSALSFFGLIIFTSKTFCNLKEMCMMQNKIKTNL